MKTLLLCPEIFASESGIQRVMRLYLKALADAARAPEDAVRLVALNDRIFPPEELARYAGGRLEAAVACGQRKGRFLAASLRLSRGCERLVCGHVRQLAAARLAKWLRPRLDYYLVAHGLEVWRPFGALERLALRGARRIFCVSEFTRAQLQARCALPSARLAVLPNALDPYFAPGAPAVAAADGGAPVLLTVSRLGRDDAYKGIDHLIAALPAIRREIPAARLQVAGRGDDAPRLQALAAQNGLDGAVEFSGFVPEARLRSLFAGCALFALPSEREGFGLVFLEAMAHGKPCVAARAGGVPEVIDESSGLLVPYGDVPALAAACVAALRRPWDAAAIRRRAEYFSFARFQQRLHELW